LVLLLTALLAFACRHREQRTEPSVHAAAASASEERAGLVPPQAPSPPPPANCAEPPADASRLESGVATRVLRPGAGSERARDNDIVTLEHSLWKRDGTLVDSTKLSGQPLLQPVRALAAPLRAAIGQMAVGETRVLWLPEHTAVGSGPELKPIPFAVTVELSLLGLTKAPATPSDLHAPPRRAKRTASGLGYQLLSEGHGAQPGAKSSVELLLTLWSSDGKVVESTAMAKTPALYGPLDLLPGLREGVTLMHAGDKMRFWLPAQLAYGEHPRQGKPAGALVADVELLTIR
jgi:FKBP-type peptidyl-prolyl cis-trans isomerase